MCSVINTISAWIVIRRKVEKEVAKVHLRFAGSARGQAPSEVLDGAKLTVTIRGNLLTNGLVAAARRFGNVTYDPHSHFFRSGAQRRARCTSRRDFRRQHRPFQRGSEAEPKAISYRFFLRYFAERIRLIDIAKCDIKAGTWRSDQAASHFHRTRRFDGGQHSQ